ncbi:MAG: tail fiber domain-containing protein [Bacteroidales bacterium]|nr:tail fiber domain-containing protein [Bacteroidales bacterium]
MKTVLLTFICLFLTNTFTKAQIHLNNEGNVGIGTFALPDNKCTVRGNSIFAPNNAEYDLHIDSFDEEPVFRPSSNINGYLGTEIRKWWYLYSYRIYGTHIYGNNVLITSDIRKKENISDLQVDLNQFQKIKAKKYDLKIDEEVKSSGGKKIKDKQYKNQVGFLAQDLLNVMPELVVHDSINDDYFINYIGMIPYLFEAIKQQQFELQALSDEVEQLKETISKINGSQKLKSGSEEAAYNANSVNSIEQNRPNPFNYETTINFCVSDNARQASIMIYDTSGKKQKNLIITDRGSSSIRINAGELKPGIYVYALVVDNQIIATKNMVISQ